MSAPFPNCDTTTPTPTATHHHSTGSVGNSKEETTGIAWHGMAWHGRGGMLVIGTRGPNDVE